MDLTIDTNGFYYPGKRNFREIRPEQVKTAEAYIKSHFWRIKTINRRCGSYRLKDWAEKWGALMNKDFNTNIFEPYISNGAFIQASKNLGYTIVPQYSMSPNAYFNMGMPSMLTMIREYERLGVM